ncbi:MAG: hypothetical protein RJA36_308 [Pseudomonadota bacterium]|jgi:hypothetical protein
MPLNHGLYTDTLWSVPITFVDAAGAAINLSGAEYVAEVYNNGVLVFTFRSVGAAADEGLIETTNAATGILRLTATEVQHAGVRAGVYRLHLFRDLTDDIWTAEGTLLIGSPGDRETYLKMDGNRTRTVNAAVVLPIIVGGTSDGITSFDAGSAATDFTSIPLWDLGNGNPGLTLGGSS